MTDDNMQITSPSKIKSLEFCKKLSEKQKWREKKW